MNPKQNDIEDIYPLTPLQRGMLFHSLKAPEAGLYVEQMACVLAGGLDAEAFAEAWHRVIQAHPALRSAFLWEGVKEPVQAVKRSVPAPFERFDWSELPLAEREVQWDEYLRRDLALGFDFKRAPLMRFALARCAHDRHRFAWTHHHLLLDGWSMPLVLGDVFALYEGLAAGREVRLPERRPFRDYLAWLKSRDAVKAEAYWREYLAGFETPTPLPLAGMNRESGQGERHLRLDVEETRQLEAAARMGHCTLNTLVQAAWALALGRCTGTREVLFGVTVSGRPADLAGSEAMVGLFINTLPLRVRMPPGLPLASWLGQLLETNLAMRQHEHAPLSDLRRWAGVPGDRPLFESLVVFENYPTDPALSGRAGGLIIEDLRYAERNSFPLTLVAGMDGSLDLRLAYDRARYTDTVAGELLAMARNLLLDMAARPLALLAELSPLSAPERLRLLEDWGGTHGGFPEPTCPHRDFESWAARRPEAPALSFEGEHLSYGGLNAWANRIAHALLERGAGAETRIALCLERSPALVAAILGALKAGAAYVPIDPNAPPARWAELLEDSGAALLLTQRNLLDRLEEAVPVAGSWAALCLDAADGITDPADPGDPTVAVDPRQAAYVIYTSGSTGRPKGVVVTHANIRRLFAATEKRFGFDRDDVWTLFHSYAFDFSVWEIWGALLHGGRLVIVPYCVSRSPEAFLALLEAEQVTVLNQTPSAFYQLAAADETRPARLALRHVVFGGEALDPARLAGWFSRRGDRAPALVNMYGITETTVHVTYARLDARAAESPASDIGTGLADLRVLVLDPDLNPAPVGVPGELHVGGAGLARGYLNRPGLTAERFVPDPYGPPGARLYRSGDLARWNPDGTLEYLGRIDQQVKIRGFRIELGEIQARLLRHPWIADAEVILREDAPGEKRLVAYWLASPGADKDRGDLRGFLAETLPDYMLPTAFVRLDHFPLTPNGKLDRKALPAPDGAGNTDRPYAPPRDVREEALARIWERVLKLDRVGIDDGFFALGGDSIRAIEVLGAARQRGWNLSLEQVYRWRSIRELAAALAPESAAAPPPAFALVGPADRARLPEDVEDAYPATALQAGMIFHSELDGAAYHVVDSLRCQGRLDIAALRTALDRAAARHPALRTSFDLDAGLGPLQRVHRHAEIPLGYDDWRDLSEAARESALAAWLERERRRGFALAVPPLLRLHVHRLADDGFQLTLTEHHTILDGWSLVSLLAELLRDYSALLDDPTAPEPSAPDNALPLLVVRERAAVDCPEGQGYWEARLAELPGATLPCLAGSESGGMDGPAHCALDAALSDDQSQALLRLARSLGMPLKSVLLAVHVRVLGLLYGGRRVATGLVCGVRPEAPGSERALGVFLNTLPLVARLDGGTWKQLILEVFQAECGLQAFRYYPLAALQRQRGGAPLFDAAFNYVNYHVGAEAVRSDTVQVLDWKTDIQPGFDFDVEFNVDPATGRIVLGMTGTASKFDAAALERVRDYYLKLFERLLAQPDGRYETFQPLAPDEWRRLREWNATDHTYPGDPCIHQLFERQAAETPEATALVCGDERLGYAELNARANRLAHWLRGRGVGPETPVAIAMERSAEMVVGLLGILKAGGAYVPLDPDYPAGRLEFMRGEVRAPVLLTQAHLAHRFPGSESLCLDTDWHRLESQPATDPDWPCDPGQLAYILYTSGSTGQPKGAMLSHRGVVNRLRWAQWRYQLGADDRVLQKTPYSFDVSVWEFFWTLMTGATLVMAPPGAHRDGEQLRGLIVREGVTTLHFVPSMLNAFLETEGLEDCASLRRVLCSGEALPSALQEKFFQRFAVPLHNLYGPTEASVDVTAWECQPGQDVPIGAPIHNTRIHVLDAHLNPAPVGVAGELCIGGVNVARGYLDRPGLTAEKFIPNPFGPPGSRLYRTGDLARWRADGQVEYLGRLDHQVKVRGFRIELGEIETALRRHPQVRDAAVIDREDRPGDKRLVAYWVGDSDGGALAAFLGQSLPEYMVPAAFVKLDALPLSANGKLDRKALPAPDWAGEARAEYIAPREGAESALAAIWAELLGLDRVGVHDNFFALGGHSILATQAAARIRAGFAVDLPLKALYEFPTLAALAAEIERRILADLEAMSEEAAESALAEEA